MLFFSHGLQSQQIFNMEQGYIHVYTGNGKGKTTAAFGLALRGTMAGKKVYVGQFVKSMAYSEDRAKEYIPNLEIEQLGLGCAFEKEIGIEDQKAAKEGLKKAKEAFLSFDIVILDEIFIAHYLGLVSESDILLLMEQKPKQVELILTGRGASEKIIAAADLVTEMLEIKHYYQRGIKSRKGIDC